MRFYLVEGKFRAMEEDMDLKKQVEILMQGTEYGDDELQAAMATELHQHYEKAPAVPGVWASCHLSHRELHIAGW